MIQLYTMELIKETIFKMINMIRPDFCVGLKQLQATCLYLIDKRVMILFTGFFNVAWKL